GQAGPYDPVCPHRSGNKTSVVLNAPLGTFAWRIELSHSSRVPGGGGGLFVSEKGFALEKGADLAPFLTRSTLLTRKVVAGVAVVSRVTVDVPRGGVARGASSCMGDLCHFGIGGAPRRGAAHRAGAAPRRWGKRCAARKFAWHARLAVRSAAW